MRRGKDRGARAPRDCRRTPGRWAPQRGFGPRPGSGFPWARAPAARGGPGGGRTTTTSERRRGGDGSRSRSAALPTTGTRLARRAARRTPPRRPPAPARGPRPPPALPPHRFIHSVHNYSYGRHDGRAARRARHRHVSARHVLAPLPRPPAPRARPPRAHTRPYTPTLQNLL